MTDLRAKPPSSPPQAQELGGNLKSVAQQILDMSAQGTLEIPDGHMPFVSLLHHLRAGLLRRLLRGRRVTPALHSPLVAVTNAVSSVIIVGTLLAAGLKGLGRHSCSAPSPSPSRRSTSSAASSSRTACFRCSRRRHR